MGSKEKLSKTLSTRVTETALIAIRAMPWPRRKKLREKLRQVVEEELRDGVNLA